MPHRQGGRQNWVPKTVTRSGSQVVVRPSARGKRNFRLLKRNQRKTGEGREGRRKEREREWERGRERGRQPGRKEGRKGKEEALTEFKDS